MTRFRGQYVAAIPESSALALQEHKPLKILALKEFNSAGAMGAWFSLTPDNEPLLLRDVWWHGDLCAALGCSVKQMLGSVNCFRRVQICGNGGLLRSPRNVHGICAQVY